MALPSAFLQTRNNSLRVLTFTCVTGAYKCTKLRGINTLNLFFKHSISPFPSNGLITKKHKELLTAAKCEEQSKGGKSGLENLGKNIQAVLSISKDKNPNIFYNIKEDKSI